MDKFLEKLADIFDVEEVTENDILEDFDEYDSLSILTIIAYVGSEYNKTLSAKEVRECKTVQDLYNIVRV